MMAFGQLRSSPAAFGATPWSVGTDFGPLFPASHALAADFLDEGVEIIAAIVVRDLVVRLDVLDCPDLDHVLDEIDFGVRPARMIDVARPVPAARAVDRPAVVDLEHIAVVELVGDFGTQLSAAVADDELPFLDRNAGEEPQPSFGSADAKMTRRRQSRRHEIMMMSPGAGARRRSTAGRSACSARCSLTLHARRHLQPIILR